MSSSSTWSDEELDWIRRRWPEDGTPELAKEHIELFGFMRSEYALRSKASVLGLKRPRGARRHFHRKWTDEMLRFLREEAPGRTRSGLAQVFKDRFGWLPSEAQLSNAMARAGAHVGTNTGRFRCGQVPCNAGKRWDEFMSLDAQQRSKAGWFPKGNAPHNMRELLSERKTKDGYWQVKTNYFRRHKANDQWVPRAQFVYEREHGPQPEGTRYIHLNGDVEDDSIENLAACPKELYPVVAGRMKGICAWHDQETFRVALAQAEIASKVWHERQKARKRGRRNGTQHGGAQRERHEGSGAEADEGRDELSGDWACRA